MTPTVYVVIVGGAAAQLSAQAHLDSWATARQVRLATPAVSAALAATGLDDVARRAEKLLERARVALGTLDDAGVDKSLTSVNQLLRDNPELPQAAWLMAEHNALKLTQLTRKGAPSEELKRLARARAILEGPRAPTLGESPSPDPAASADVQVEVRGLRRGDRMFWNGVQQLSPPKVAAGEHHVRILRRGKIALAAWAQLGKKARMVNIPAPTPCSSADLLGATATSGRAQPPAGATCPRWIIVRAGDRGVDVARCSGSSCGPLLPWRQGDGEVYRGPPQPREPDPFPTWVAVGTSVGAAILTTIVLWNTGVFDERKPGRTRFVYTGPNETQGLGLRY